MKIEPIKNLKVGTLGAEVQSLRASIAEDSKQFLFGMLSRNLYSNPIGSIVREITSNCFDAHKEANVDDPVVILKGRDDDEGTYITFKDVGIGLSPERVHNVFMNYFSSTKRTTDDLIGGFGLGSKSPLSYADYFYITTISDKKKYSYILSLGDDVPILDLLSEEETEERNGTEVKIYLKNREDEERFRSELKSQLCYFDNVWFSENWKIDNDYRIYETQYFKYRNKDQYNNEMHIVLGKVSYPIDWNVLGMEPIEIPIGVKFSIGELQVTPNREQVRYTEEITDLVKARVNLAFKECLGMFNEQNEPKSNYFDWYQLRKTKPFVAFKRIEKDANGTEHEIIDKLYLPGIKEVTKRHRLTIAEGIPFLEDEELLSKLYSLVAIFEEGTILDGSRAKGRKRRYYWHHRQELTPDMPENSRVFITTGHTCTEAFAYTMQRGYVFHEKPVITRTEGKINYKNLKYTEGGNNRVFVLASDEQLHKEVLAPGERDRRKLDLDLYDKGRVQFGNTFAYFNLGMSRKVYAALKELRRQVREHFASYRELSLAEIQAFKKWKDENNQALQRKKQGKVFCKNIASRYKGDTYEWPFNDVKERILPQGSKEKRRKHKGRKYRLEKAGIKNYKGIVIYGFLKDVVSLKKAVAFLGQFRRFTKGAKPSYPLNDKAVRVIQISKQAEEFFMGKHNQGNMIHVDNLYSDNKLFRELASSLKIEDYLANTVRHMSYNIDSYIGELEKINSGIAGIFRSLHNYWKECNSRDVSGTDIERSDLKHEIIEIAEKHNLFDPLVEDKFKQIDAWFKDIEWMKYLEINNETLPVILKGLREKKKKVNLDYYQKIVIEDKFTVKGVDRAQLSLELVVQEEIGPKFKVLTKNAA